MDQLLHFIIHNLTVTEIKYMTTFVDLWSEHDAGQGGSEVLTAVFKFFEEEKKNSKEYIDLSQFVVECKTKTEYVYYAVQCIKLIEIKKNFGAC